MAVGNALNVFRFSGFKLDAAQRKLFNAEGKELNLSSRAFDTLFTLIEHRGETLSKAFLIKAVWPSVVVEENNLNQAISSLRKALQDSKNESRFIQTVSGRGYRFVAEVESDEDITSHSAASDTPRQQSTAATPNNTSSKGLNYTTLSLAFVAFLFVLGTVFYFINKQGVSESSSSVLSTTLQNDSEFNLGTIPNSIAVLPFTNLNPNSENTLFSLSLHDEVINQLSKINSLNVIARGSVLALSTPDESINELGQRLQVESIMTGTVLFIEEQARVNLQMLEPKTGITLWTATYDVNTTDLSNMIAIQSDIATNVALTLEAEINQQEQQDMSTIPTSSFEAYRYNLAARNTYYTQDFAKTWALEKQALELDPDYFDALYTYSYVNTVLTATPVQGMTSHQHFELAIEAAEKIIALFPEKHEGYGLKATALSTNKEWRLMAAEITKLQSMGASLADMKFYALILSCLGDFAGAIEILEANLLIEPVNLYGRGFLLAAYELNGEREKSREAYEIGEELNSDWWGDTVNIFLALGRKEPLSDIDSLLNVSGELKEMLNNIDNASIIKRGLENFEKQDLKISAEAVYYSAIAAYSGEPELAIDFMRAALGDVWLSFHWVWLPVFDDARKGDSFKQLLRDSGIVSYWQQNGWPEVCQPEGESFNCNWSAYP